MESVLKMIQRTNCASGKADADRSKILLAYNDCWFQYECDDNLIEACIFQREELSARYRYLLGKAKQLGVSCNP